MADDGGLGGDIHDSIAGKICDLCSEPCEANQELCVPARVRPWLGLRRRSRPPRVGLHAAQPAPRCAGAARVWRALTAVSRVCCVTPPSAATCWTARSRRVRRRRAATTRSAWSATSSPFAANGARRRPLSGAGAVCRAGCRKRSWRSTRAVWAPWARADAPPLVRGAQRARSNRKTGFKCPRGCGKTTAYDRPCPGKVDKSHPIHPRAEATKRRKKAAPAPASPPAPAKPAPKPLAKPADKPPVAPAAPAPAKALAAPAKSGASASSASTTAVASKPSALPAASAKCVACAASVP